MFRLIDDLFESWERRAFARFSWGVFLMVFVILAYLFDNIVDLAKGFIIIYVAYFLLSGKAREEVRGFFLPETKQDSINSRVPEKSDFSKTTSPLVIPLPFKLNGNGISCLFTDLSNSLSGKYKSTYEDSGFRDKYLPPKSLLSLTKRIGSVSFKLRDEIDTGSLPRFSTTLSNTTKPSPTQISATVKFTLACFSNLSIK